MDGRDRSLDYKISGSTCQKVRRTQGRRELAPAPDEILFQDLIGLHLDQHRLCAAIRVRYLTAGCLTDQCRLGGARCLRLGPSGTVPTDACVTLSQERHDSSLRNNRGYCRQITSRALLDEIARLTRSG